MSSYLLLTTIIALTIAGDIALKYSTTSEAAQYNYNLFIGIALYSATAIGWAKLMRTYELIDIAVLYSSATIILLSAVGVLMFGEQLSIRRTIGVCLALASILLIEDGKEGMT